MWSRPDIPKIDAEPTASVLNCLAIEADETGLIRGHSLPQCRSQLYGGQVLAQGLIAAAGATASTRLPHSAHTYFMRSGSTDLPVDYRPTELRRGRSFSTVHVDVEQSDRHLATMSVSFQEAQTGAEFSHSMPDVPGPDEVSCALDLVADDHPVGKFLGKTASFAMRHIPGPLYTGTSSEQHHTQYVWLRPRAPIPACDQLIHRALLTYVSDQFMLEPALRAQGLTWLSPGLALATLDHAMWYLRDTDINEWHLFAQRACSSQGGRSLTRASIFREDGTLVAECMQEGMIRSNAASSWSFELPPVP